MKIKRVRIHNWRSIRDIEIRCHDLMVFIGQNNHGKSNILSALLFFFGELKPSEFDFHQSSNELWVEATFGDLDEKDKTTFAKYLTRDGTFCVRKSADREGGQSYNGYVEMPDEAWLQEDNAQEYTVREVAQSTPLAEYLPSSGRISKKDVIEAQIKYIEQYKHKLSFKYRLEQSPFMGQKNVAKGLFGDIYYVPAVKDLSDEFSVKSNSVFNQLYLRAIERMSETNEDYRIAKDKIVELVSSLNKIDREGNENTKRPAELMRLEEQLEQELSSWGARVEVEITPPNIDEVFRLGTKVWVDDGFKTDVNHKGHGLQRALIFALIRSLAQVGAEREAAAAREESRVSGRQKSGSSFFIIEEPELYLHPQAQRQFFQSLLRLATTDSQVFLCTHSSSFISLDHYQSICIVRREDPMSGTICLQCTDDLFADKSEKDEFNLVYWINPDRGELFFAKKVVLVEGATDKTIIPLLAENIGCFRHDYSIIDCGSKDSIPSYIAVLNKFRIPYIAVYDKDHQEYKDQNGWNSADKSSEKIVTAIDAGLGDVVVFENDIEEELGLYDRSDKNKPYVALKHVSSDEFRLDERLKRKIERIYS